MTPNPPVTACKGQCSLLYHYAIVIPFWWLKMLMEKKGILQNVPNDNDWMSFARVTYRLPTRDINWVATDIFTDILGEVSVKYRWGVGVLPTISDNMYMYAHTSQLICRPISRSTVNCVLVEYRSRHQLRIGWDIHRVLVEYQSSID